MLELSSAALEKIHKSKVWHFSEHSYITQLFVIGYTKVFGLLPTGIVLNNMQFLVQLHVLLINYILAFRSCWTELRSACHDSDLCAICGFSVATPSFYRNFYLNNWCFIYKSVLNYTYWIVNNNNNETEILTLLAHPVNIK